MKKVNVQIQTILPDLELRARAMVMRELESCHKLAYRLSEKNILDSIGLTEAELMDAVERSGQQVQERLKEVYAAAQVPLELLEIQRFWINCQHKHGNEGSCVLGAGFEFDYKGQQYEMPPAGPYQCSMTWEASKDEIEGLLIKAGATNITYDWGNMD
jgi:hypothetical protein